MRKKECIFLILISLMLLLLSACSSENNENLEVEKGLSEVRFLENQCITIFNKYISNEYLNYKEEIDWELLEEDYTILKDSLDVILIDFASIKISSKDIVELESNFNNLNSILKEKDFDKFIMEICDCYYLVSSSILDSISQNEVLKLEKNAKSNLLYIGYYMKHFNKEETLNYIMKLQDIIAKLNSNNEYIENNSYKVNRIFLDVQKIKEFVNEEKFINSEEVLVELLEFF